MIYVMGLDGNIIASSVSNINQGENGASEIILLAPFPSYYIVRVKVKLPNGLILPASLTEPEAADFTMTLIADLENFSHVTATDGTQIGYNAWKIAVLYPITQNFGNAKISFVLTGANGVTKTSTEVDLTINKGTPLIEGEMPTPEDIEEILNYVSLAGMYAANAEGYAQGAEISQDNALRSAMRAESAKNDAEAAAGEAISAKDAIGGMLNGFNDEINYLESEVATLNAEKADKTEVAEKADKTEVNALETRVNLIEGALIEFDTDNSTEYKKPVPLTSAHKAYINSIGGKTIGGVGANKFDPYLFSNVFENFMVSDAGMISGYTNAPNDEPYTLWGALTLPAGTWTISTYTPSGGNSMGISFYVDSFYFNTITLTEPSAVDISYTVSMGFTEYNFGVMINEGSTALPYEPYEYGPTAVTAIKSYSANLIKFPYEGTKWDASVGENVPFFYDVGAVHYDRGITYTVREDRSVEVVGTAESGSYMSLARGVDLGTKAIGGGAASAQSTNGQYSISSLLYWGPNGAKVLTIAPYPTGSTFNDILYPMANRGSRLLPYVPYFDPITYTIPSEMIALLPGYGYSMPDGTHPNVLDLDAKKYIENTIVHMTDGRAYDFEVAADPREIDVSQYLTDLMPNGYFSVTVQGGGEIEFVNAYDEPVPSDITFLLAPR